MRNLGNTPSDEIIANMKSVTDFVIYGGQTLDAANITGTLDYFAQSIGTAGVKMTNLPNVNTIPANWEYFECLFIGIRLMAKPDFDNLITVFQDATYKFTVADYDYKTGHLIELAYPSAYSAVDTTTVVSSGAPGISTFQSDQRIGGHVPLLPGLTIPLIANNNFNFKITFETDNADFHSKRLYVLLKGKLHRKIVG